MCLSFAAFHTVLCFVLGPRWTSYQRNKLSSLSPSWGFPGRVHLPRVPALHLHSQYLSNSLAASGPLCSHQSAAKGSFLSEGSSSRRRGSTSWNRREKTFQRKYRNIETIRVLIRHNPATKSCRRPDVTTVTANRKSRMRACACTRVGLRLPPTLVWNPS